MERSVTYRGGTDCMVSDYIGGIVSDERGTEVERCDAYGVVADWRVRIGWYRNRGEFLG